MYFFFTVLAFMALSVSGFFPEMVRDSDVDLVNLAPYRRDARQLIGSKIKVNYLSSLVANPNQLKLPINDNATALLTQIELQPGENPYDESGIMKNAEPDPDGTDALTMNCMYGNILIQLRELKDIQSDYGEGVDKIWSNTYQSDMILTTTIGENSKLWAAQDKYPDLEDKSRVYASQQTCWPTHGFHLHTGGGDNVEVSYGQTSMRLAGYHLGPLCTSAEYFDVARRECARCTSGQMPDWFSSIYIRKYDDAQFYDESCGGMASKFENVSQRFLGNKDGPYFCRKLIEGIGFADLHGGLDPQSALDPAVIQCLHQSCAKDIDIEFQKIQPVEAWGFKNLHMGNYNPFPPIECKASVAQAEDRRGECGRCSILSPFCESKPIASGTSDKPSCQSQRDGSVPWGLHTINRKDYMYSIPEYNENMALHIMPDELRFEGPDLSKYMGKTREQMQLEYCFHMNIDQTCLPAGSVKKAPTPLAVLPTKNIFVDEGNLEPPYYHFFLNEDCSSDELTNTGNDTYVLESNVEYVFARCGNASTHPFNVHPLGDDPNYIGISNDTLRIQRTGATGKLYEWYCSSHPTIMKGKFVAKQEGHSHRRLYEIQSQTVTPTAATSTTSDGASTSTKLASRLLVQEKNPLKRLKPARAKLVMPLSSVRSRVLLVDDTQRGPDEISELAQKQGWDLGERINGFEYFIEDAMNITACAEAIKDAYPEANGASFDVHSKHCFASVNSTSHNSNKRYVSKHFAPVVIPPAIGFHLPKEWQINHISSPSTVSVGFGLEVPDKQGEYSGFVINGSGYVRGFTNIDDVNFYRLYRFNLHEDLGTIKSWHYSIEYLDSEEAMVEAPKKTRREIIAIGANNIAQDGKSWASLHVIETSGIGKEKSLCLAGFLSKSIREIHGIAVLPFTQNDIYLDPTLNKTTLHKVEGGAGFTGSLDEKNRKYDNGMIVASITDPTGRIKTWVSSYNGVPMDTGPSNPGDVYNPFSIKWNRYAVHKVQMERDYLLMAVIDDETNTVYVWDGDIDEDESFQVIPGKGIVSDADNSRYGAKPESAIVLPIRDLYWTADEKLIVLTDIDVFMYTRIREDLPFALCQNKKRQQEINALIDPGYSWSLSHFCEIEPEPCQPGKYQDERGKQSCKNCALGQFQPGETSTSCIECARGRFQYVEGETSCENCMPGFFSGETGSPGLGPGEHASIMLDYVCEKCPIGYFSMEKSATHCKKCVSPDHCDIESQIFPHAQCTPDSDEWEKHTDHIHEYCCSTEKYSAQYITTLNMPIDWRLQPNIYCVNRRKIKVQSPVTDCGDFSKMIKDAMKRQVEDDLLDSLGRLDLDDIENADSSDLDILLVSLDSLVAKEEEGEDPVQARADIESNYTLALIQNITSTYIECQMANQDVITDNFEFTKIASNITDILRSQTELPRGVMFETEAFINNSFFNQTFEEAFSADTADCFATVEPKTIYPQLKACCDDFADTNPQLFKEDGSLNVAPGENLYCFDVYEAENVDPIAYDPITMTMNDIILENNEDIPESDEDTEQNIGGFLGCFIRKENYTNFHPLIPEIAECCPAAMDEVRNSTWNVWDFSTEDGAASCYTATNGDCYIHYSFYNESKTEQTPVPAFIQEGLCQDVGYTYIPETVEVVAERECPDEWKSTFINQRTIFTTALTQDGECDEGWTENFGELEYRALYTGTCSDIGFDVIEMRDCYGSEIWKDYFDNTKYDQLEWEGIPDARAIPSTCVLAPLVEVTECEDEPNGGQECFTSNKRYTAEQIEKLFEYLVNGTHTQLCTEEHPCLCARETTCSKLDTICSAENPCMCTLNTTECVYAPEINVTECECLDHIETPSPGKSTFLTSHDNYTEYELTKTILPREFNLVQGVSVDTGALIVNKDQWENITKDDLPLGISRSADSWNGYYDENYLYNVKAYETEEVLIDMKGGIDWEATRGTDEFRYCRHQFEVINDKVIEMSVNMFNATANETYLVKQNQTVKVTSLDAIYCSSFFPIARLTDTGDWTCSSVQECPYWEFWPRPINAYGFVETDPCLCDGVKQYGGYCIPDMSYVLPKKGDPFQVAFDTHYSQVPGTKIAMSQDGSTFVTTLNDNIQAYSIGDPVIGGSVAQKGSALASSDNVAIVMSDDGTTFAKMTLFDNKLQIFGYSSQWSLQKEFVVSAQATNWNYEIVLTGTCASNGAVEPISQADCEAATIELGLGDGGGSYGELGYAGSWTGDPRPRCTYYHTYDQKVRYITTDDKVTGASSSYQAICKKLPELAMSKDGKTIAVTQSKSSIQVYHMSNSGWQERASITTSGVPLYVDVSDDGSMIAISTAGAAYIYEWENSAWTQRGDAIVDSNSQIDKIALSGDGLSIAISKSVDKTVEVYAWKSTYWKRRGASVQADATKGLHVSSDNSVMVTCAEHVNLYRYKRKAWTLMHSSVFNAESCSLSHDGSMVGVVAGSSSQIKLMTTSLETDVYDTEEIWVTDLDAYFKQPSYEKYAGECPIGSIMKASAMSNITDIEWWEDAYDRACMCEGSMCNGYAAHDLLVGLSEDIDQEKLLTMTCASDGCLYDIIDSERWSVTEEYAKDCSGAVSEVCGIYSFGRFNDKMPYQPLYGVYDEDGDVNTGMFKCPFQNGMRRNDFRLDSTLDGGIFFRDGDFDLAPNGKPLLCACGAESCHYNQYCRVTEDGTGFCGNTKNELETKILEASVLLACKVVPEDIFQVELGNFEAPTDCTCGDKFCKEGQYCTSNGCRECVCGEYEYEHVDWGLSTCHKISECELGEYVSKIQTRYSDRECAQCEHGVTYSPFQNAYSCEPCKICPGEIISLCNIVNNTVCAKVCPDGQRDRGGTCMDICERTQHEMPDGSCIEFCDYGTYFDEDQCVDCPQGTYTAKRGKDLARSGEIEDVCRPHKVCNFLTHFYAESPNASFPGRCATRYQGHCAIRIRGDEYNDDNCTQLRQVNNRDIIRAHAFTKNISNTDFMPFDSENTVTNANAIRLKTSQYGCPAQTFVWTGSLWRGSDRELILQGDKLYCHAIGGGNFGSYSLSANFLEYEYKVVIPREHGELFEEEIVEALELLETNTLSSRRASFSAFKTVARYISADLKSEFVNGYLDVELKLKTRIFAHLDQRTVDKFNFVTPFSLDSVDSDIEQVFLSTDIQFTQSPFQCDSMQDGIYLCVIL